MNKNIIVGVIVAAVAIVGTLAFVGGQQAPAPVAVTTSPSGSTFNTAKQALVAVNLAGIGANGTSTSILNTDSSDRYVTALKTGCTGVGTSNNFGSTGIAALTFTFATTSTAAPTALTSITMMGTTTVATSTPFFSVASSTTGSAGVSNVKNIWASGSYLTAFANATNTAVCTVGVEYFGS